MTKDSQGFEVNFQKLERLSQDLQENKVTIDELVPKMKDALASIKVCKEVLRQTKAQLKEINDEFVEIAADTDDQPS